MSDNNSQAGVAARPLTMEQASQLHGEFRAQALKILIPYLTMTAKPGESYWHLAARRLGVQMNRGYNAQIQAEVERLKQLNDNKPLFFDLRQGRGSTVIAMSDAEIQETVECMIEAAVNKGKLPPLNKTR